MACSLGGGEFLEGLGGFLEFGCEFVKVGARGAVRVLGCDCAGGEGCVFDRGFDRGHGLASLGRFR